MKEIDLMEAMNTQNRKMSKSHKAIASYISQNYKKAVFMTAAKLGEAVGVSESTVVRFAIGIGYEGYPEFQKALEQWVGNQFENMQQTDYQGAFSRSEVLQSVLLSDIERIKNTIGSIDATSFETAVDSLLSADKVYIVGLRSCEPLANFLAFYLQIIRGNVSLVRTTSVTEMFEQMIRVNDKDVVVGISFPRYSMRTLKAMEFANDRNARVIAITDNEHSPMKLYSSCNLFAQSDSIGIVDSLVAPLSVINALVAEMCMRQPQRVTENLKELERTWDNYQVYLNDEIDFLGENPVTEYSLRKKGDKGKNHE